MQRLVRRQGGGEIRKNKTIVRLIVMIFMSAAVIFAVGAICRRSSHNQDRLDIRPDQDARQGTLYTGESREVEDGSFWVLINQLPTMEDGTEECPIQYENPSGNHYSSRVSLYLEESGELLGNTTRVDPGYYVEEISLKERLPPGEYPLTARIELFENQTPAGEMSLGITLRVIEKRAEARAIKQMDTKTDRSKNRGEGGSTG